ncbi:DUF2924 domain-containing protein [Sulfitobacter sp. HNIBRBA3233]|uniref:DUF2924 domain-containing protein n=1 Tax=Sulfitobacter marinivivus TaxID=3158558 RepID=UPI0032DE7E52
MTVTDIETMDRATLIDTWSALLRTPVPKGLSKALMRRFLAIEMQTRRYGGLTKQVRKALRQPKDNTPRPRSPALKPGGRILREWNGVTHVVEIGEDGFIWKGTRYRSLSAIAREITGAHWSGPRFFGLNGASKS